MHAFWCFLMTVNQKLLLCRKWTCLLHKVVYKCAYLGLRCSTASPWWGCRLRRLHRWRKQSSCAAEEAGPWGPPHTAGAAPMDQGGIRRSPFAAPGNTPHMAFSFMVKMTTARWKSRRCAHQAEIWIQVWKLGLVGAQVRAAAAERLGQGAVQPGGSSTHRTN